MTIKNRLQRAYKSFTSQSLGQSISGSVLRNYGKQSEFRPQQQLRGITYKAIDKIGMSVSVYKPRVVNAKGDFVANHPVYTIASKPNVRQTGHYFHHLEAMLYEIYGETFWYFARGEQTNKIKEIYLLDPSQMELVIDDGELLGYVLHKANGQQVPFTVDEVYHDKRPNPFNEWRGMSVMERASQYLDIELVTTSFTLNYMRNNASPSGIVSLPDMDKATFKQFAQQWREGYEGPENAGKTAFIRGGEATFKAVGATLKDVDQKITRDMAKDDVLMMFDMPKGLLGASGEKGMGRSETEALEYIYSKHKIEPMMDRLDEVYEYIVRDSFPTSVDSEVTHTSSVPMDKQYVLDQNHKGVDRWITRNEARETMGLPPIDGGDVLAPIQEQPIKPATKKVVLRKISKSEQLKKDQETKEVFRSKLVETNELFVTKIKSFFSEYLTKQQSEIIGKINAKSKAYEEWLFNVKEDSEILAAALIPIILELMEAQSEDVANFITGELLTISPEIRRDVEQNILKLAGEVNTETIKALEKTLAEGQAQGESLVKLKKRVEQVYADAKGYRAERIARTESLKASNTTAELVYKQNGFNKVQWFVNPGACEFCRVYSGRTKEIGAKFIPVGEVVDGANGGQMRIEYSDITTPPLHPNCTCSIVPV